VPLAFTAPPSLTRVYVGSPGLVVHELIVAPSRLADNTVDALSEAKRNKWNVVP
jgi:hypothetical protein